MRVSFRVIPSFYHEQRETNIHPEKLAIQHAVGKVRRAKIPKRARFVLGADTIVVYRKKILGKPLSSKEAIQMLRMLSGRWHKVITGLALLDCQTGETKTAYAVTDVQMNKLSLKQIEHYLNAIDPFDKAGSYAIQEGPRIVRRIQGSYSNVIGLPKSLLRQMLRSMREDSDCE